MKPTLYAIVEAALAVAMGVDDLLRAVFFRHVRKAAVPIQDARGRVVEKQNEECMDMTTIVGDKFHPNWNYYNI